MGYNVYTWDHIGDHWEWYASAATKMGLRSIIRHCRKHWEDWGFLVVAGTATDAGYLAAEEAEVNCIEVQDRGS